MLHFRLLLWGALSVTPQWRRIILLSWSFTAPTLALCSTLALPLLINTTVESFTWLSQLIYILAHIIFIIVIPRTANKVILLTVVMLVVGNLGLETRGRGTAAWGVVRLLAVYFGERNSIDATDTDIWRVRDICIQSGWILYLPRWKNRLLGHLVIHLSLRVHYDSSLIVSWVPNVLLLLGVVNSFKWVRPLLCVLLVMLDIRIKLIWIRITDTVIRCC